MVDKTKSKLAAADGTPMIVDPQSHVADADNDIAITYTTGDPSITTNGAITIADGSTPTVAELLEFCEELNAAIAALDTTVNSVLSSLEAHGLHKES